MYSKTVKRRNNFKKNWSKNYPKKRNFQNFFKLKNKKHNRVYWWKPTLRKVLHSLKKILNILKKQKAFSIKLKHVRLKKKKRKRRLKFIKFKFHNFHKWRKKKKKSVDVLFILLN